MTTTTFQVKGNVVICEQYLSSILLLEDAGSMWRLAVLYGLREIFVNTCQVQLHWIPHSLQAKVLFVHFDDKLGSGSDLAFLILDLLKEDSIRENQLTSFVMITWWK